MNINEALSELDKTNDDHWTKDGAPRLDVVSELVGKEVKRKDVVDADPEYTRESRPDAPADKDESVPEPEPYADESVEEEKPRDPYAILEKPRTELFRDEASLIAFREDASTIINDWDKERKALTKKIESLSRILQRADRMLTHINNAKPNSDTADVRAYLEGQKKVRAERANRALALRERGLTLEAVANSIIGKAPLDMALNQRKPKPGSTRPDPRMPVRGTRQAEV